MAKMNDSELASLVDGMIASIETDGASEHRTRALEYYRGQMDDTPADAKRSQAVSRDVRAAIRKVMPSLMRTFMASDRVVEFEPQGREDEDAAKQATDLVNYVFLRQCDGYRVMWSAMHDALLLRNGVIKHWWETTKRVEFSSHSGLSDEAFAKLTEDKDVQVLEHTSEPLPGEFAAMFMPGAMLHSVKIKRTVTKRALAVMAVPPEEFGIDPSATSIEDAQFIVHRCRSKTRSDLIAMGYDRKKVDVIPSFSAITEEEDDARNPDGRGWRYSLDVGDKASERVEYFEVECRIDYDGDGITELRRVCMSGRGGDNAILANETISEYSFSDITPEIVPHRWEGRSLFDDVEDIQRIKTVLTRQTLDNLYWQNNLQPIVQEGTVSNPDAILKPEFGKPIRVKAGIDPRMAVSSLNVPFVAEKSFAMLQYLDAMLQDRTGVSDASSGLDPDALQNQTATATQLISEGGIAAVELIARTMAEGGFKRMFRCILRLIVENQDKPETIRLRNKWVDFDPRGWNASMDANISVGLGAGSRERDLMALTAVSTRQEKIIAAFGADNPFVKPEHIAAVNARFVEAAGLRDPSAYFAEPDPQEVAAKLEALRNQPDPEERKLEVQMTLEREKAAASERKEQAQMEADVKVRAAELARDQELAREKAQIDMALADKKIEFEREKFFAEIALKERELEARERADMMKAQAASEALDHKRENDAEGRFERASAAFGERENEEATT